MRFSVGLTARVAAAAWASLALADPWFDVNPSSHNFGQVEVGDTASFSFYVTNVGSDTGSFSAEMSGIGQGLVLDPDQSPHWWTVAPGDSASVAVLFQPAGPGYRHRVMVVRWSIFFSFNDVSGTGVLPDTLPAPQGLTLRYLGDSQLRLRWQGSGTPGYLVYVGDSAGGPFDSLVGFTADTELTLPLPESPQQFYLVMATDSIPPARQQTTRQ